MRHQKTRHKLSRTTAHRKALLANLCVEIIDHEPRKRVGVVAGGGPEAQAQTSSM